MATSGKTPAASQSPTESRAAEFVTIGWMLTVMTTFACELLGGGLGLYTYQFAPASTGIALLVSLLWFAAIVVGILSLGLMVATLRLRRERPPRGILVFACLTAVVPWLFTAYQMIF